MKRKNLFLGMFFVFLGVFFLLNNFNIINFSVWTAILDLWPLFLVLLGVHLISTNPLINIISWIAFFVIIILYAIFMQNGGLNLNLFDLRRLI